ncbi:hypothetical protein B0H12DRAFT_959400, partial [Mycena haematopus]
MRKMVNSMSAKMEIGSPMASLYLLGNPDHYASHKYVPFAWRHKFVPSSSVDDYRYRPEAYNMVNLYEWIQCSHKRKRSVKERTIFEEDIQHSRPDYYKSELNILKEEEELGSDLEDLLEDEPYEEDFEHEKSRPTYYPFVADHVLFLSHCVTCNFGNLYTMIPNFIGGSIPRSDKGDRAAYCMTMLTLFKPWRSPTDLKDIVSTWDQVFKEHTFTKHQTQLMKNFDIRYECNDARDDHFAQMRKKMQEAKVGGNDLWPAGFLSYKDKFAEDLNDFDYGSDDDGVNDIDDDVEKGPRTLRMLAEAKDISNIMQTSGWLNISINGLPEVDTD